MMTDSVGKVMTSAIGGVSTAAGLGFQYLATLRALLTMVERDEFDFSLTTEHETIDAIDYAISSGDQILVAAQAKGSVDLRQGNTLGPADFLEIAQGLITVEANEYRIDTNRPLGRTLTDLLAWLPNNLDLSEAREPDWPPGLRAPIQKKLRALTAEERRRLLRVRVVHSKVPNDELAGALAARILDHRRRNLRGVGAQSARILMSYLIAEILFLSGRRHGRVLTRAQAENLLDPSAHSLAGALGAYDWGHFLGPFPVFERVARADGLDKLLGFLPDPPRRERPRLLAITGFSGVGKSTLAACFADLTAARYDHVVWFDATASASIHTQALSLLQSNNVTDLSDIPAAFRDLMARSPKTWLIIFDNAGGARDLETWIVPHGHVDVIATTTAQNAWSTWRRLALDVMEKEDALELVRVRLGLASFTQHELRQAADLLKTLDYWPLAIELACAYLGQSGRGLSFTGQYLTRVRERVIDDEALVPSGYRTHRTLLQAVLVALDDVSRADRSSSPRTMTGRALLDLLAYLPPRQAPVQLAATALIGMTSSRLEEDLVTTPDNQIALDDALTRISGTSLIQVLPTPVVGRCTRMNAIVAELVRRTHDAAATVRFLSVLHATIDSSLRKALDSEDYPLANALIASSDFIVDLSLRAGIVSTQTLTTIGNMAGLAQRQGLFASALRLLERELSLLNLIDDSPSILRAKIFAQMLTSQIYLNLSHDRIASTVEAGIQVCESFSGDDSEALARLRQPVEQIVEMLSALSDAASFAHASRIPEWLSRLHAFKAMPGIASTVSIAMRGEGNEGAGLTLIEEQLKTELGTSDRLYLTFSKGDVLTTLGRYSEAATVFRTAIEQAKTHGLGLGPGWTSLLNAWQWAVRGVILLDMDTAAREFSTTLEELIGPDIPDLPDDRQKLALCRAATCCERGPAALVEPRITEVSGLTFSSSLLVRDAAAANMLADACHTIVDLRRRLAWPPLFGLTRFARGTVDEVPVDILYVNESLPAPEENALESFNARWVASDLGVGLFLPKPSSAIIWACIHPLGWLGPHSEVREPGDPAAVRLHDLIVNQRFNSVAVLTESAPSDPSGTVTVTRQVMIQGSMSVQ